MVIFVQYFPKILHLLRTTVKGMTDKCNKTPPRTIDHDNGLVTSIRQITNIANKHYIQKIDKIRQNFNT